MQTDHKPHRVFAEFWQRSKAQVRRLECSVLCRRRRRRRWRARLERASERHKQCQECRRRRRGRERRRMGSDTSIRGLVNPKKLLLGRYVFGEVCVAYHYCLNLHATFSQPRTSIFTCSEASRSRDDNRPFFFFFWQDLSNRAL